MSVNAATITGAARNYIEIMFRRKWIFLVPVIVFTSISIGVSFILPPKYRSMALLAVKEEQMENPHIRGVAAVTPVRERLPMIQEKLKSRSRLISVIRSLGLDSQLKDEWGLEALVGSLRNAIKVQLQHQGNLFSIICEHQDPVTCQKVVELLTDLFIKENLALEKRETSIGIEFLESQRAIYRANLEEAEAKLTTFKKENQQTILSLPAAKELGELLGVQTMTNVNLLRFTNYRGDLIEMRMNLQTLTARQDYLQQALKTTDRYVISQRIHEINPIVRELKKTLTEKRIELHRLLLDSTENHPLVLKLKHDIERIKEELEKLAEETVKQETRSINPLYQELEKSLGQTNAQIAALEKKLQITEIFMKDLHKEIEDIPEVERKLTDLQRGYSIYNGRYMNLSSRLETAKITERLESIEKGVKFELFERPRVPLQPFKPNRKAIALIGLVAGFFVGGALVFAAEATDHSFGEISQLKQFLEIPVMGSVSQILTVEEAEFNKSKKRLGLVSLVVFIIFIFLGVVAKYILTTR